MGRQSDKQKTLQRLIKSDALDLFSEVQGLTETEKVLILENNYRRRLIRIGRKYGYEVVKEMQSNVRGAGGALAAADRCREMFSAEMQAEYMAEALDHAERSLRCGWEIERENVNRVAAKEYNESVKAMPSLLKKTVPIPPKLEYEKFSTWILREDVEQVLSNRKGYSGNFYSVYFGTREEDVTFFQHLRKEIEEGKGAIKATDEAEINRKAIEKRYKVNEKVAHARVENVVRTETSRAMNAGTRASAKASGLIVGYKFIATKDDRVTVYCYERNGKIFRADDIDLLDRCTPPLHYQCRSVLLPLTQLMWEREGGDEQAEADYYELVSAEDFEWH